MDGASHLRWNLLKLDGEGLTVRKLCPTRWSSRFSPIRAVKDKQEAIIRLLTKIVLMRQEGRDVAEGLLKRIKRKFEKSNCEKSCTGINFYLIIAVDFILLMFNLF